MPRIDNWQPRRSTAAKRLAEPENKSTSLSKKKSNSSPYIVPRGRSNFRSFSEQVSEVQPKSFEISGQPEYQNLLSNADKAQFEFPANNVNYRSSRQRNNIKTLEESLNTERHKSQKRTERLPANNFRRVDSFSNSYTTENNFLANEFSVPSGTSGERYSVERRRGENIETNSQFSQRSRSQSSGRGRLKYKDTNPVDQFNEAPSRGNNRSFTKTSTNPSSLNSGRNNRNGRISSRTRTFQNQQPQLSTAGQQSNWSEGGIPLTEPTLQKHIFSVVDQQQQLPPQTPDLGLQSHEVLFTNQNLDQQIQSSLQVPPNSGVSLNQEVNGFTFSSPVPQQFFSQDSKNVLKESKSVTETGSFQQGGEFLKANNEDYLTSTPTGPTQSNDYVYSNFQNNRRSGQTFNNDGSERVQNQGYIRNQIERRIDSVDGENVSNRNYNRNRSRGNSNYVQTSEANLEVSTRFPPRRNFRQGLPRKTSVNQPQSNEQKLTTTPSIPVSTEQQKEEKSWRNVVRRRQRVQTVSSQNVPSSTISEKIDRNDEGTPSYPSEPITTTSQKSLPAPQKTDFKGRLNIKTPESKLEEDIDESANYPKEFLEKLKSTKNKVPGVPRSISRREPNSNFQSPLSTKFKDNSFRLKRKQISTTITPDDKKLPETNEQISENKPTEAEKFATTTEVSKQRYSQRFYKKLSASRTQDSSATKTDDIKPVGTEKTIKSSPVEETESQFLKPTSEILEAVRVSSSEERHKFVPKKKLSNEERKQRIAKLKEKLQKNATDFEPKQEESKESLVIQANTYPNLRQEVSTEIVKTRSESKSESSVTVIKAKGLENKKPEGRKIISKVEGSSNNYDLITLGSEENVQTIFVGKTVADESSQPSSSTSATTVLESSTPTSTPLPSTTTTATINRTPRTATSTSTSRSFPSTTQPDFAVLNVTLFPSTRHRFSARINSTVRPNSAADSPSTITPSPFLVEVSRNLSIAEKNLDSSLRVDLLNSSISAASADRGNNQTLSSDSLVKVTTPKSVNSSTTNKPTVKTSVRSTTKRSKKKSSRKKSGKKSKNKSSGNGTTTKKPPRNTTLKITLKIGDNNTSTTMVRLETGNFSRNANNNSTNVQPLSLAFSEIQSIINETIEVVNSNPMTSPSFGVVPRSELNALTPETITNSEKNEEATEETTENSMSTTPTITNINDNSTNQAGSSRNVSSGVECNNGTCKNSISQLVYFNESNPNTSREPLPYARMRGTTKSPETLRNIFIYGIFSNNTVQRKPFPAREKLTFGQVSSTTAAPYTAGDYYVFGVYPNNSVVRRRGWKTFDYEKYKSPYVIFGIYPNNTIVKKYPNGTTINDEFMVSDNEIRKSFSEGKLCRPCSESNDRQSTTGRPSSEIKQSNSTTTTPSPPETTMEPDQSTENEFENDQSNGAKIVGTESVENAETTTETDMTTTKFDDDENDEEEEEEPEESEESDESEEDENDEKESADYESSTTTESSTESTESTTRKSSGAQESLIEAEEADGVSTPRVEEFTTNASADLSSSDPEALEKAEDADNASTPQDCRDESTTENPDTESVNESLTDAKEAGSNNFSEFTTEGSIEENTEEFDRISSTRAPFRETTTVRSENVETDVFDEATEKSENIVDESFHSKTTPGYYFDHTTEKPYNLEESTEKLFDFSQNLESRTTQRPEFTTNLFDLSFNEGTKKEINLQETEKPTESNHWQSFVSDLFGIEKVSENTTPYGLESTTKLPFANYDEEIRSEINSYDFQGTERPTEGIQYLTNGLYGGQQISENSTAYGVESTTKSPFVNQGDETRTEVNGFQFQGTEGPTESNHFQSFASDLFGTEKSQESTTTYGAETTTKPPFVVYAQGIQTESNGFDFQGTDRPTESSHLPSFVNGLLGAEKVYENSTAYGVEFTTKSPSLNSNEEIRSEVNSFEFQGTERPSESIQFLTNGLYGGQQFSENSTAYGAESTTKSPFNNYGDEIRSEINSFEIQDTERPTETIQYLTNGLYGSQQSPENSTAYGVESTTKSPFINYGDEIKSEVNGFEFQGTERPTEKNHFQSFASDLFGTEKSQESTTTYGVETTTKPPYIVYAQEFKTESNGFDLQGTERPTESNHLESLVSDLFGTEKNNNFKPTEVTSFESEKASLKETENHSTEAEEKFTTTEGNFRIDLGFESRTTDTTKEPNAITTTSAPFDFDIRQLFFQNGSTPDQSSKIETTTSRTVEEITTKRSNTPSRLTDLKENEKLQLFTTPPTEIPSTTEATTSSSASAYFYEKPTGSPFDVNSVLFNNFKTNIFGTGTENPEKPFTTLPYVEETTAAPQKAETPHFPTTDNFDVRELSELINKLTTGAFGSINTTPTDDGNFPSITQRFDGEATTTDDLLNALLPLSLEYIQGTANGNSIAKRHRKSVDFADAEPSSLTNLAYRALSSSNPTTTSLPILTTTKSPTSTSTPRNKKKKLKNLSKTSVTAYKNLTHRTSTVAPDEVFIVTPEATTRDNLVSTDSYSKRGKVKFVTLTPGVLVTTNVHDENDILTMSSQHVQKVTKAPAKIPDNFLSTVFGDIEEKASSPIPDILKNVENDIQGDNLSVSLAKRIITLALEKAMTSTTEPTVASTEKTTAAYLIESTTNAPRFTTPAFEVKRTTAAYSPTTTTTTTTPSTTTVRKPTTTTTTTTTTRKPTTTSTRKPRTTSTTTTTTTTPRPTTTTVRTTTTTTTTTTVPTPETILITPKKLLGDFASNGETSDRTKTAPALDTLTVLLSADQGIPSSTPPNNQKVTEDLNVLLSSLWDSQNIKSSPTTEVNKVTEPRRKPTKERTNNLYQNQASAALSSSDLKILEAILQQQGAGAATQDLQQIVQNQIRLAEEVRKASRNLKKKQRLTTTTTTTTENPNPLGLGFLLNLFGSGSRPNVLSETRNPKRQRPFFGSFTTLNNGSGPTPDPFNELDESSTTAERSARGELVSAAIDVTKAVSKFMGTVLSSAAQSFQNFFRSFGR